MINVVPVHVPSESRAKPVVNLLQSRGFRIQGERVQEGVTLILGEKSDSERLLAMIVEAPENEITKHHLGHLVTKESQHQAGKTILITDLEVNTRLTDLAADHDVQITTPNDLAGKKTTDSNPKLSIGPDTLATTDRSDYVSRLGILTQKIHSVEHWELATLMFLTVVVMIGYYVLWTMLFYPVFNLFVAPISTLVYLGFAIAVAIGIGYIKLRRTVQHPPASSIPLTPQKDPHLHEWLDSVCEELQMQKPDLYIKNSDTLNAAAVGTRWNGRIHLNKKLYNELTDEEVKAIVGHEIAHLYYFDSLPTGIANWIVSFQQRVAFVLTLPYRVLFSGAARYSRYRDIRAYGRIMQALLHFWLVVTALPVILAKNSLSRYREFVADRTGAQLVGSSEAMFSALTKIKQSRKRREANETANPQSSLGPINIVNTRVPLVYKTHPSVERRTQFVQDYFTDTGDPGPTEAGPTLGTMTTYGLTVAPVLIIAVLIGSVGYPLVEPAVGGFVDDLPIIPLLLGAVLALGWFIGIFAFSWAMLFAKGGSPFLGFVSVVCLVFFLIAGPVSIVIPYADLLGGLGYIGMSLISGVQLWRIVTHS